MRKAYYILLAVLLFAGLTFILTGNREKRELGKKTGKELPESSQTDNKYENLRNLAFTVRPEELGYTDLGEGEVFAVISEMNIDGAIVTVTAFLDGTTSLYLSTGAVFIGAGEHEDVKPYVLDLVNSSKDYLQFAERIQFAEKPDLGEVIFNFRMPGGTARVIGESGQMESGESDYSDLFYKLNDVITQIRMKSQQ